jgi:hypothetical protein
MPRSRQATRSVEARRHVELNLRERCRTSMNETTNETAPGHPWGREHRRSFGVHAGKITGLDLAAPGEPDDDRALNEVRLARLAVSMNEPRGKVQPIEQLRARVTELVTAENDCNSAAVGMALPSLIRDLHTTLNARRDEREVLWLLTLAHMQGTQAWLASIGAPMDLSWQAASLARSAAERLDEPAPVAVSAFGTSLGLLGAGAFDLASQTLD